MPDSPNLALPFLESGQAQKHVTHNEALRLLDTLVQLAVLDRGVAAPPGSPAEGERWIVGSSASGAFTGHADEVAAWQDGAWQFSAPQPGWVAFVVDEATLYYWTGSSWDSLQGAITALQNLSLLGIGTTADASNPLAAKLNNILFTAKYASESGDGDLRCKLNKESAGDTVSQLYQTGYSGRAETGLIGNDDFTIKVSPNGSAWHDGIVVDKDSGKVSFPSGIDGAQARERLAADRTYYVRTDGSNSNTGLVNSAGGAFLTWQYALDVVHQTLDLNGYNITIQAGGASGTFTGAILIAGPFVGAKSRSSVQLIGDTTTPANFILKTTTADTVVTAYDGAMLALKGFKLESSGGGMLVNTLKGAVVLINGNMEYGATSGVAHLFPQHGSIIEITASYTISGGAAAHWRAQNLGFLIVMGAITVTLTGTPAFGTAFAYATMNSNVQAPGGATYSGAATGKRYDAQTNGTINVGGATLPGNGAGTTATGGQYV